MVFINRSLTLSQLASTSAKSTHLLQLPPYLTKDQLKDIVVNVVLASVVPGKLEDLGEVHGPLLLVDLQLTRDKDQNTVVK